MGNVTAALTNNYDQPFVINCGDRMAQMVVYHISQTNVEEVQQLQPTKTGDNSFGSSGLATPKIHHIQSGVDILDHIIQMSSIKPYNIDLFQERITIPITITGTHPTLGMVIKNTEHQHRLQLQHMVKGTPGNKIPIKHGIILSFNNTPIACMDNLTQAIAKV